MKRLFTVTLFCFFIYSSLAQTIVWIELASLPQGYYCGEAVTLNNEIYVIGDTIDGNADWRSYTSVYEGEFITDNSKD